MWTGQGPRAERVAGAVVPDDVPYRIAVNPAGEAPAFNIVMELFDWSPRLSRHSGETVFSKTFIPIGRK